MVVLGHNGAGDKEVSMLVEKSVVLKEEERDEEGWGGKVTENRDCLRSLTRTPMPPQHLLPNRLKEQIDI